MFDSIEIFRYLTTSIRNYIARSNTFFNIICKDTIKAHTYVSRYLLIGDKNMFKLARLSQISTIINKKHLQMYIF